MQDVSYHNGATPQAQPQAAFVILPAAVFLDERLSDRDVRVLGAIATQANKLRITPPIAQSWIARKVSSQRPRVNESITALVEKRYLEVFHHGSAKGGRAANTYRVLFDTKGNPIPPTNGGNALDMDCNEESCVTTQEHNYDVEFPHRNTTHTIAAQLSNRTGTQLDKFLERDTTGGELSNPTGTTNTGSQNRRNTGSQIQSSEADQDQDLRVPREESSPPDVDEAMPQIRKHPVLWRELATKLEPDDFKRSNWLGRCELVECDGAFIVGTPTTFARDHVTQKYGDALAANLRILARTRGIAFQSLDIVAPPAKPKHSETPPASYSHAM